ncbi:MAG TPA: thioredoxin domain-containing protein [Oligoflexia bacterium]|nr:thioredoxin domain-containing protein [Oligoflexia bacterium]HMP47856.1 thioredoxin domain-containing protein [Oligoflexia bacterium]
MKSILPVSSPKSKSTLIIKPGYLRTGYLRAGVLTFAAISLLPGLTQAADLDGASFEKAMDAYIAKDENIEKISNAIQGYFTKKKEAEMRSMQLAEEKRMEEQFNNPVKIDIADSPVKGPKDAKVAVVVFSDFQCPFCARGKDLVDQIEKEYPKDVKIVFKHLPLDFHPQAIPASRATLAAEKQGKFWEMHDFLFLNQTKLADSYYEEAAKEIGLDLAKFKADFENPATEARVLKDLELAKSLGVQGTPNFYVNGVNIRGALPFPEFKKIIDKWLARK